MLWNVSVAFDDVPRKGIVLFSSNSTVNLTVAWQLLVLRSCRNWVSEFFLSNKVKVSSTNQNQTGEKAWGEKEENWRENAAIQTRNISLIVMGKQKKNLDKPFCKYVRHFGCLDDTNVMRHVTVCQFTAPRVHLEFFASGVSTGSSVWYPP